MIAERKISVRKNIISVFIMSCLIFNTVSVFGEDVLKTDAERDIINTEAFTEENVIYSALQSMDTGVSLFSDAPEEIAAGFDVVLGFDMSGEMRSFDYNEDMSWTEGFAALQEQVPDGTRFSVVTDEPGSFETGLNDILALMPDVYSESPDIITLLENCKGTFDEESNGRNKIIIAAAAKAEDVSELSDSMEELRADGVIPFIFILNPTVNEELKDIDGVYQCENELQLRTSISELYLSFAEFDNAMLLSDAVTLNTGTYTSDFRDRHDFANSALTSQRGGLLAEILNIYGCVPLRANVSGGDGYSLMGCSDIESFLNGDNKAFAESNPSGLTDFVNTWNNIFTAASSDNSNIWVSDNVDEIIEKNLKRRFPLVALEGDTYKIIKDSSDMDADYVFDTYEYIMQTLVYGSALTDESSINGVQVQIDITCPVGYSLDDSNVFMSVPAVSWNADTVNQKLTFTANDGDTIIVSFLATYENGVMDLYNPNKAYVAKVYSDVQSKSEWYYDFVFEATNKQIINGYPDGTFLPNGEVTRGEFLKMVLNAAGYEFENAEGTVWAQNYLQKANDMGLLLDYIYRDYNASIDEDIRLEYQQELLTRKEASYILLKLFIENDNTEEDNKPLIPSVLFNYDTENTNNEKLARWNNGEFTDVGLDLTDDVNRAIFQMYANGVIVGYGDGAFGPDNGITRAETCKVITKSMFTMDDAEMIVANVYGDGYGGLNTGEEKTGTIGQNGRAVYELSVDPDGTYASNTDGKLYKVSTTDNVSYELITKDSININAVSNESSPKYRLKTGDKVLLQITGTPGDEFSVVVNDCWSDSKRAYIVVYDSYSDEFGQVNPVTNGTDNAVTSRYHDADLQNYEYSVDFFKNYFNAVGNRNISFIINIRDWDFDGNTGYADNGDGEFQKKETTYCLPQNPDDESDEENLNAHSDKIKETLKSKYTEIVNNMLTALDDVNDVRVEKIDIPEIYISSPHLRHDTVHAADLPYAQGLIGTEYNGLSDSEKIKKYISDRYTDISMEIYEYVAEASYVDGKYENCITGMYFGREDPDVIYESDGSKHISYMCKEKLAQEVHDLNGKMLWIPYSVTYDGGSMDEKIKSDAQWENIGMVVNHGTYHDESENRERAIFDVVMMQPGIFYSNFGVTRQTSMDKLDNLYESVRYQKMMMKNENGDYEVIGGETAEGIQTATIAFEMEYDISIVTGRWHNARVFPQQKIQNFKTTLNKYRDMIYDDTTSWGIYGGGPNEQNFDAVIESNTEADNPNRHSVINHITAIGREDDGVITDSGEHVEYYKFNNTNTNLGEHANRYLSPDEAYNNMLYDITKGLFLNDWSDKIKEVLGL